MPLKIIDPENAENRAKLQALKPMAKEAIAIIEAQYKLTEKAKLLMKKSGCPDNQMDQYPLNYCYDLVRTYGQLTIAVEG